MHVPEPAEEKEPAVQLVHVAMEVAVSAAEDVPAGHEVHVAAPEAEYFPTPHCVHAVAPAAEK